MTPTRWHYFFAQKWPFWLWIILVPLLSAALMASFLGTPPADLAEFGPDAKRYIFLVGMGLLLGYFAGGLLGYFVLGPVYHYRAELNGAPFRTGDIVQILVGRNRGRIVRVTEVTEGRGVLKVDLGESNPKGKPIYYEFTEIVKADDPEPTSASPP